MNYRTCNKCGWVHFTVTRAQAERQVAQFNDYFEKLSPELKKRLYGGKPSDIGLFERCHQCANSCKDFRDSKLDDCPDGCTISPIIYEESES